VLATTVGRLADISPNLPIAMFAAASLGSFLTAAFLPETQVCTLNIAAMFAAASLGSFLTAAFLPETQVCTLYIAAMFVAASLSHSTPAKGCRTPIRVKPLAHSLCGEYRS
jgi:hypothetical protein